MAVKDNETSAMKRRVPRQARSRRRVEEILDTASRLVLDGGVAALTTRGIAQAADIPVASLYQYFADKEAVLLALVERDMLEMDAQVVADLDELRLLSVASLVETTMGAFVKVYHRRPAFVEIWLRGRANPAIRNRGREHNIGVAELLRAFAVDAGLTSDDLPDSTAFLAVEMGDRIFQLAYERDSLGDPEMIREGMRAVTAYLTLYATPAGREGIAR